MTNDYTSSILSLRDTLRTTYQTDAANAELDRMLAHAADRLDDLPTRGDLFDNDQPDYDAEIDASVDAPMIADLYTHGGFEMQSKIDNHLERERELQRSTQERSWW